MRIVGIDEAGRGPVLGPLVVGLLSIPEEDESMLAEHDISDSKHHSAKKRALQYFGLFIHRFIFESFFVPVGDFYSQGPTSTKSKLLCILCRYSRSAESKFVFRDS